jgi:hypothetical protein
MAKKGFETMVWFERSRQRFDKDVVILFSSNISTDQNIVQGFLNEE